MGFNLEFYKDKFDCIRATILEKAEGIQHVFCTRLGGVSDGLYGSLNCGFATSDDPAKIRQNRSLAMYRLGIGTAYLITCNQRHTARAIFVRDPKGHDSFQEADGMVTNCSGIALGVLTADCIPILLADPKAKIIGAVHAGWRGALGGVINSTVELMVKHGATLSDICAAIGPCIGQESYEVGAEFREQFLAKDNLTESFFRTGSKNQKFWFDLSGFARWELENIGIFQNSLSTHDTCS